MKLREGAVEYGRIYEQKMAALFSIRCALDPLVADFWILSNVDDFGAFDDIVLLVEGHDSSKRLYCIQLKHIENKSLQAVQLESDKGNFRLEKYYESYQEIKKNINNVEVLKGVAMEQIYFILYTNAPLSGKYSTVSIKLEIKEGIDLLCTTSKLNNTFQLSNIAGKDNNFDANFLEHFFLYTDQASATALDSLIKSQFDLHFDDISNATITTITDYFFKWAIGKKNRIKRIFKKDVQIKLLECILQPYVIEPKNNVLGEVSTLKLLNDTVVNFNVTPVMRKKSLKHIFASIIYTIQELCDVQLNFDSSWNTNLAEKCHEILKASDKKTTQQINGVLKERQQFVAHLTVKDLYLATWECNLIPLIINCDISEDSVQKLLSKFENVTKHLSFVLFSPSTTGILMANLTVFNSFTDIHDVKLINENLENMKVSLQGKSILNLKEFQRSVDVLAEVTPDIYVLLLNEVLQIGEKYEIENYYIKRSLQRPRLSYSVLNKSTVLEEMRSSQNRVEAIYLLVESNETEYIPYKYIANMVDLDVYLKNCTSGKISEEKYIVTTNSSCNAGDVMQLITYFQTETNKAVHVMKPLESSLQWLFSHGPIDELHAYLEESTILIGNNDTHVPEVNMLDQFKSDVNIISNNAGMGKTLMLKSLANKFEPSKWVCFINVSEHIPKISEINEEYVRKYVDYIVDYQTKMSDKMVVKFCKQIFLNRWNSRKMVWLVDGYDEASSEETLNFLKRIKHTRKVKLWITTRSTYKRELETHMDTLALQITHFRKDEHDVFLWKYFDTFHDFYGYDKNQTQHIINSINKYSISLDETFVAIPLQTRMLAEIFGDDINRVTEREKFTIVDLYNNFVDVKLKEYKSYEATSLKKTLSKLALKLFFTDDQLDELLDSEELAEEALAFQESYKKDSIVIGLNEDGDAVFGHRTFAEFLAARWLTKQIITKKGLCNVAWMPLVEKLFYVDMMSVRIFFDTILCQTLPLHLAVLNNNMERIQLLLNEEACDRLALDKLGRSALHLAVSYGKYYDLYVASNIQGLRAIGLHTVIQELGDECRINMADRKTQLQIPTEVIEKLLVHGFSNTPDLLFNYDVFDYAMKSCSLDSLNCLFEKLEKNSLLFEPGFNFKIFLFCVVNDNLHNILSKRKVYNYDLYPVHHELRDMFLGNNFKLLKMKYNESYLTEIAAYMGGKETLFELLQTGQLSLQDGLPVHKACFSGQSDVVDLLYKMGADVKNQDTVGWSPAHTHFYQSGKRVQTDITFEFLKDAKYLERNSTMTPIHFASQGGHLECIKKLITLGARVIQVDGFGNTPLFYASLYGHMDCVEFMINTLSDEEKGDKSVQILLNIAASKGYSVEKFVKCGLNVNNIDDDGNTPLILASKNGFPKVIEELAQSQKCDLNLMKTNESLKTNREWPILQSVEKLIKWGLNISNDEDDELSSVMLASKMFLPKMSMALAQSHNSDLNLRFSETLGSIRNQTRSEHLPYFKKLFNLGVGKDETASGGLTALHFAVLERHVDCVTKLIAVGADKSAEDTIGLGYSPLIWAALKGYDEIIDVLLATPEHTQRELEDAEIALIWASISGFEACVNVLLNRIGDVGNFESARNQERIEGILKSEFGANYNKIVRPLGEVKNIPLVVSAINNHENVIRLLMLNRYRNNENMKAALVCASTKCHLKCVKLLIESEFNESGTEEALEGLSLVWASVYGQSEIVNFFLTNKPDDYFNDNHVQLALQLAAKWGHFDCLKLLLDFMSDASSCDIALLSACEYHGTPEVINELLSRNRDVNVKNDEGLSPLDFFASNRMFGFVKKILDMGAHRGSIVEENSNLFKNLQDALDWAVATDDYEMIYRLVELGIRKKLNTD